MARFTKEQGPEIDVFIGQQLFGWTYDGERWLTEEQMLTGKRGPLLSFSSDRVWAEKALDEIKKHVQLTCQITTHQGEWDLDIDWRGDHAGHVRETYGTEAEVAMKIALTVASLIEVLDDGRTGFVSA